MHVSYKPARLRALPVLLLGLLAALGVVAASGAVTGTGTYVNRQTYAQDLGNGVTGVTVDSNNKPAEVDLTGKVERVASGTNTKTLVYNGYPCGNASMAYTTHSDGTYTRTNATSWNSQPSVPDSGCALDVLSNNKPYQADMWGPSGYHKLFSSGINPGQTVTDGTDSRGTATSKTQWSLMEDFNGNIRYACAYLSPGSAGFWTLSTCSV